MKSILTKHPIIVKTKESERRIAVRKRMLNVLTMLVLVSICCASVGVAAASTVENVSTPPDTIDVSQNKTLTLPNTEEIGGGISTFGYGGAAPQVTQIELYDYGTMNDNPDHFAVVLKVTGYGNDRNRAFFNGQSVTKQQIGYFINYGTTADGFYYLYDCGPVTEAGVYEFTTIYRSTNSPYSELPFSVFFNFESGLGNND